MLRLSVANPLLRVGFVFVLMIGLGIGVGCSEMPMMGSVPDWELSLMVDGQEVVVPLEVMNVYLVEDESYPETYEIIGDGVSLVGEFPIELHVGYGEDWQVLFGKTIPIAARISNWGEVRASKLTIEGLGEVEVLGGTFTADKLDGKYSGSEGDLTLSGRISIDVRTEAGDKVIQGTFAVHGVSWG